MGGPWASRGKGCYKTGAALLMRLTPSFPPVLVTCGLSVPMESS